MGNKKPPLAHRITSNRSGAVGFLCFLEVLSIAREFDPLQLQNRPISGRFASFSRYFKITLPIISSLNFLSAFVAFSFEKMKNTAFSRGVFRLYLFWRHRLAQREGFEPSWDCSQTDFERNSTEKSLLYFDISLLFAMETIPRCEEVLFLRTWGFSFLCGPKSHWAPFRHHIYLPLLIPNFHAKCQSCLCSKRKRLVIFGNLKC